MTKRFFGCAVFMLGLVAAGARVTELGVSAQQLKKPMAGTGQPDISGIWGAGYAGVWTVNLEPTPYLKKLGMPPIPSGIQSNSGDVPMPIRRPPPAAVIDPPDGILPYQPWALERRNSVMKDYPRPQPWQIDTQTRGWPSGIPRENHYSSVDGSYGGPIQILQPPGYVVFIYETHHEFRIVPLDGRPQPGQDIKMWLGSSRGHWEGNTLVIEVANNNDSPRMDVIGDFRSDAMKATEHWTRTDKDTLEYKVTIDDPKVFTRPFTLATTYKPAIKGLEIMEYAGVEGDKSAGIATEEAAKRAAGQKK